MTCRKQATAAFTWIELLVVLAILLILACILLPGMGRARERALRVRCTNNLKQIGISFKGWAIDNYDRFPSQVLTNKDGTIEPRTGTNVYVHFLVMSNELATPTVLHCPTDTQRACATNFSTLTNANISYFVNLDAQDTTPQMLLTGDRNLTNGLAVTNHVLYLATNLPVGWTHELHGLQGNVVLADGSVQQMSTSRLREGLRNAGAVTRLLMP